MQVLDEISVARRAGRGERVDWERRAAHRPIEVRQTPGGGLELEGYAAMFNAPYEVEDWLGTYTEEVMPGAFTKTLAERDDVRLLLNHEGLPLARTKSGTLVLTQDAIGLHVAASLDASDPDVQRIIPKMTRGDLGEMSHAFQAMQQLWDEDYTYRKLVEEKLWDVSIVTYPASPTTWAALRDAELLARIGELEPKALALQLREQGEGRTAVRALSTLLGVLIEARQEGPGEPEDEPAEEAEEITDLQVLQSQLTTALQQVQMMLDEEAEDVVPAGARDGARTISVDEALRELELVKLRAR